MDLLELHPQGTIGIVTRRVPRSPDVVDLGPRARPRRPDAPAAVPTAAGRAALVGLAGRAAPARGRAHP